MDRPSSPRRRRWFVTGCSSGLGRALCERLLARGEHVVATARDVSSIADLAAQYPQTATTVTLDVIDNASVAKAAKAAMALPGGVDVLVNNAGYGVVGAMEEVDEDMIKEAFDANFLGAYRLIRTFLPHMRERGSGHILNVSSMTGFVGAPGFCFYSATKFALEGMSEALAKEVAPFGIKVTLIEPGPFRTKFRGRSLRMSHPMDAYADTIGRMRKSMIESDGKQPGDPLRGADAMIAIVDADNPPMRLPLGEMCVKQMRDKLAAVASELDQWSKLSLATSFDSGQ